MLPIVLTDSFVISSFYFYVNRDKLKLLDLSSYLSLFYIATDIITNKTIQKSVVIVC